MNLNGFIKRHRRAKKLGINYWGIKNFELPSKVTINNQVKEVRFPNDSEEALVAFKHFQIIMLADVYKLNEFESKLSSDINILDIGGNMGVFSLVARSYFPKATIHLYEPNKELEKYLRIQAEAANFSYYMEAVGDCDGKVDLVNLDSSARSELCSVRINLESGDIPMIGIDKAIERIGGKVDLLKMDCEGAEWLILENKDAWQSINNITMEYHLEKTNPAKTVEELKDILKELGFKISFFEIGPKGKAGMLTASKIKV